MREATSLSATISRLTAHDIDIESIDLRGKGRGKKLLTDEDTSTSDGRIPQTDAPRTDILCFAAALQKYTAACPTITPSSIHPSQSRLKYLAFHNHFLDRCEIPLLLDATSCIHTLEHLCLFNHDMGDDGVETLVQALSGNGCNERNLQQEARGLEELYLSHCYITCKGASAIAKALESSSSSSNNMLKNLQVLSLGSNCIKEEGAHALAKAFGKYPSLQRLVMHGNDVRQEADNERRIPLHLHAILPTGWNLSTTLAMNIFAPLILPHIQHRWEKDLVLVRPYELLRKRLREKMYESKDYTTFVDDNLEVMPGILAWVGRTGPCCMTSMQSQSISRDGGRIIICHENNASGQCRACGTIHLNDVNELFKRMPHIVSMFQGISTNI